MGIKLSANDFNKLNNTSTTSGRPKEEKKNEKMYLTPDEWEDKQYDLTAKEKKNVIVKVGIFEYNIRKWEKEKAELKQWEKQNKFGIGIRKFLIGI